MYTHDTDALSRQSAVADIRAFLASDGLREEALASYINGLSSRCHLDIATARRLFVAEVKKQAERRRARPPWQPRDWAD